MARPAFGRLPVSITRAARPTRRQFLPIADFGGVFQGVWRPTSTTETVTHVWYEPKLDVASNILFSVLWSTSSTTTTQTATFRILYKRLALNTTAVAVGATALDTVIAADNAIATASALLETPQGTLNAATLTDDDALSLALNCNAVSGLTLDMAGTSLITVYGVIVEYTSTYLS